ncbi:MAG TPA: NAD-glutamate dehydrogenase domain-containing protein, partial [Steroidobacteraceae bacterium]
VRVIGEGGNLGVSQRGRIEYALAGGRLNTDFIDNSAGVNTSDVEVNLKILLNGLEKAGKLARAQRNRLLRSMTREVASLVLRNNYLQSQAISTLALSASVRLPEYHQVIRALERGGDLNREIEFLPADEDIAERARLGLGLTRPEIAVVLAYSKIWLSHQLLHSNVPEDPYLSRELERYFPRAVRERFPQAIARHRLRREIIVTATTNSLVNRMGPTFVLRAQADTGADPAQIARAYTIAREVFDMRDLWAEIEALDNRVAASAQYGMMERTSAVMRHVSYWLLGARRRELHVDRAVAEFRGATGQLAQTIGTLVTGCDRERYQGLRAKLIAAGIPARLAERVAGLEALEAAFDVIELAKQHRERVLEVGKLYFELGERTGLDWLREQIGALKVDGQWQPIARMGLREQAARVHRRLTEDVLKRGSRAAVAVRVTAWVGALGAQYEPWRRTLTDMRAAGKADFATLSVGVEAVRKLAEE